MDSIKTENFDNIVDLDADDSWGCFDSGSFRVRSNTWPVAPKSDPFSEFDGQEQQPSLAQQCLSVGSHNGSQATLTSLNNSGIALNETIIPTTANDVSVSAAIGASNGDICGAGQYDSIGDLVGAGKKNTSRRNAWGNMSYADLITQAINSSPDRRLTLSQIYDWMVQNVPYFKDKGDSNSSAGWKVNWSLHINVHFQLTTSRAPLTCCSFLECVLV